MYRDEEKIWNYWYYNCFFWEGFLYFIKIYGGNMILNLYMCGMFYLEKRNLEFKKIKKVYVVDVFLIIYMNCFKNLFGKMEGGGGGWGVGVLWNWCI